MAEKVALARNNSYLAYISIDCKVKIWETSSGRLDQEYTPADHLSASCTSISWGSSPLDTVSLSKKKKLSKSGEDLRDLHLLAIGTSTGKILLYSVSKAALHTMLQNAHVGAVTDICWHRNELYTCSEDQNIIEWDVRTSQQKHKWRGDKLAVGGICVTDLGDKSILISASSTIKCWDLADRSCTKTFLGHASPVTKLLVTKGGGGRDLVLSAASNDRHVLAWNLDGSDNAKNYASFMLSDEAASMSVCNVNSGESYLAVLTASGVVQIFDLSFEKALKKPRMPVATIQVAFSTSGLENGTSRKAKQRERPQSAPILSALWDFNVRDSSSLRLFIAYGSVSCPAFEYVAFSEMKRDTCLVREPKKFVGPAGMLESATLVKSVPITKTNLSTLVVGQMMVANGNAVPKAKKSKEETEKLPMEERLILDSMEGGGRVGGEEGGAQQPKADNFVHLLLQGLQSNDKEILTRLLSRSVDESIIRNTVSRLPITALMPFLIELNNRMDHKNISLYCVMKWFKIFLQHHASYLMSCEETEQQLQSVLYQLEARTGMYDRLSRLRGRLEMIVTMTKSHSGPNPAYIHKPLAVFQEPGSSSSSEEESDEEDDDDEEGESNNSDDDEMKDDEDNSGGDDDSDSVTTHPADYVDSEDEDKTPMVNGHNKTTSHNSGDEMQSNDDDDDD